MLEKKASPEGGQGKEFKPNHTGLVDREKVKLFGSAPNRSDKKTLLRAAIDGDCLLFCPVFGASGSDPEYAIPGGGRMKLSELRTWVESKRSLLLGPEE